MGTLVGPGVGARTQVEVVNESTWGAYVTGLLLGTNGHSLTIVSESIKCNISSLVSNTLTPNRGITDTIRGQFDISGDINFEFGPDAGEKTQIIKQAMCYSAAGGANYTKTRAAIGQWGMQVHGTQLAAAANLVLKGPSTIAANWPSSGDCIVINRTTAGALSVSVETYTNKVTVGHQTTLTIAALAGSHLNNAWAFPYESAPSKWGATYLHYMELGANIGIGMNIDILRDISLFVYTGMKVSSWTMNFNPGEIVTGAFSFIGKEENCGGRLTAEVVNAAGAITMSLDDIRIFNDGMGVLPSAIGGTLLIGHEGGVSYATIQAGGLTFPAGQIVTTAGAPGTLALGTDVCAGGSGYFIGTPVSPTNSRANFGGARKYLYDDTVLELTPYTGFEAAAEMRSGLRGGATPDDLGCETVEIVSATFTLDNGLYTDKFVLGSRTRACLPEQRRQVTGSLNFEFDNIKQYRKFVDGTEFGFIIRLVSEGEYIDNTGGGAVDVPYSACFYFHRCKYSGDTPNVSGPDIMLTDMPFQALYHQGVVTSPVAATDDMGFTELTCWFTTSRSADLWT